MWKQVLIVFGLVTHGMIQVMNDSTPEMNSDNWYRFSKVDSTPDWEKEDTDEVEEDDYSENSTPYEE